MKAATLAVVAHTALGVRQQAAAAVDAATWLHYAIFQAAVVAIVSASSMVIALMTRLTGRPGACFGTWHGSAFSRTSVATKLCL